jgi:hypothetical protein
MDDITRKRLAKAVQGLPSNAATTESPLKMPRSRANRRIFILTCLATVILAGSLGFLFLTRKAAPTPRPSVVPTSITKQAHFLVPYPDPLKLPHGYSLDLNSFSGTDQAVVYSASYDQDKKIAFTVQKKPSDDELRAFYANQIPIRNEVKVSAGMAAIGVLNNQTFASLPTEGDSWLLITAPKDIDPNDLKKILQAIRVD